MIGPISQDAIKEGATLIVQRAVVVFSGNVEFLLSC